MVAEPPAAGTVVFVHGLWMTGLEMSLLRARVARAGFGTCRFHYRSTALPLVDHSARLAAFVRARGRVHVVAHSMGGLVTLGMLRDHGDVELGRVVLLGSPVRGSAVAARASERTWLRRALGAAAEGALVAREPVDWRVEHQPSVGVIAGTRPIGLGRWIGGLDGPNDGAVSVAETRLDGAADQLELRHSHAAMLLSRRLAREVIAFLRTGRFVGR
ncbi:MAG: alpha/beta fold hydrolase [Vicinamibacteria bacterium]|nr:alpha/beta fold hydrolase [Vicinamibacteria bacterium]